MAKLMGQDELGKVVEGEFSKYYGADWSEGTSQTQLYGVKFVPAPDNDNGHFEKTNSFTLRVQGKVHKGRKKFIPEGIAADVMNSPIKETIYNQMVSKLQITKTQEEFNEMANKLRDEILETFGIPESKIGTWEES